MGCKYHVDKNSMNPSKEPSNSNAQEATRALDPGSEKLVQNAPEIVMQGKTVILNARRL